MKQKIRINESTLRKIVAESVRRILKESYSPQQFKEELRDKFYNDLLEICMETAENYYGEKGYYYEDICEDYASESAEKFSNDAIKLLNSNDWDVPYSNFRPFGYVMDSEYNVHNIQEFLSLPNPVEVFVNWFWDAFGTYGFKYNFGGYLSEYYDDEDEED